MVWEQENKKMSEVLHLENKPGQACRLANPCHRKTLGLEPVKGCRFRSELSTLYFICRRAWDLSDKLPSETKYKKKNYIYVCHMSYIYVCHQPHHAHHIFCRGLLFQCSSVWIMTLRSPEVTQDGGTTLLGARRSTLFANVRNSF